MSFEFWHPPKPSEIEVSVFGKGYGEAILLHVGDGRWLIIDSFKDECKHPIAITYLNSIGVNLSTDVRLVAASHWHDDHIGGLAEVLATCTAARFAMPFPMMRDEFAAFATKYDDDRDLKTSSGVREMATILDLVHGRNQAIEWSMSWRLIHQENASNLSHGNNVLVNCMSPSNADVTDFLRTVKSDADAPKKLRQRAPRYSKNDISAAMWITIGPVTILLGADLEDKPNPASGWKAVLAANQLPTGRAQVMKIAHHGSITGHHPQVWSEMCVPEVTATLAPWAKGNGRLPSASDVQRILSQTGNGFSTNHSATTNSKERMRMVGGVIRDRGAKIRKIEPRIGHVRHRFDLASQNPVWITDLGGQACPLHQVHP